MHGHGSLTLSDGLKYMGEFRVGKWDGEGTHFYPDGRKFIGTWKDGLRDGHGTYISSEGREIYAGWYRQVKDMVKARKLFQTEENMLVNGRTD